MPGSRIVILSPKIHALLSCQPAEAQDTHEILSGFLSRALELTAAQMTWTRRIATRTRHPHLTFTVSG